MQSYKRYRISPHPCDLRNILLHFVCSDVYKLSTESLSICTRINLTWIMRSHILHADVVVTKFLKLSSTVPILVPCYSFLNVSLSLNTCHNTINRLILLFNNTKSLHKIYFSMFPCSTAEISL
jgi:isocitrate dehydrogenase kinase/phosphatase